MRAPSPYRSAPCSTSVCVCVCVRYARDLTEHYGAEINQYVGGLVCVR